MFKKIMLVASAGLLTVSLAAFAVAGASWNVFGTSEKTKQALESSGVYDTVVASIVDTATQSSQNTSTDIPLDQPEIEQAIQQAFPPEFIQQNSELFIDGMFGWLTGATKQPEFSIDITDAKQQLITGVGTYAQTRYDGLPTCTTEQVQALTNTDLDPLQVPCQIPSITSAMVKQQFEAELATNQEFLNDTVLTNTDLPKDETGKPVTENISSAPTVYQTLKLLPWILGIVTAVLMGLVLLLSSRKRTGLRNIGVALLGTGLFLLASTQVTIYIMRRFTESANIDNGTAQRHITDVIVSLTSLFNAAQRNYYIGYIVLGLVVLVSLFAYGRLRPDTSPDAPKTPTDTPKEATEDTKTPTQTASTETVTATEVTSEKKINS